MSDKKLDMEKATIVGALAMRPPSIRDGNEKSEPTSFLKKRNSIKPREWNPIFRTLKTRTRKKVQSTGYLHGYLSSAHW